MAFVEAQIQSDKFDAALMDAFLPLLIDQLNDKAVIIKTVFSE